MVVMLLQNNIYQEHWVQSASQSVMASALQAGKEEEVCSDSWSQVLITHLVLSAEEVGGQTCQSPGSIHFVKHRNEWVSRKQQERRK